MCEAELAQFFPNNQQNWVTIVQFLWSWRGCLPWDCKVSFKWFLSFFNIIWISPFLLFSAMVKHLAENPLDRVGLFNGDLKPAQFLKSMENKWQQDTYVPEGEITEKEPKACPCDEWNCHKRCCRWMMPWSWRNLLQSSHTIIPDVLHY
jgi:hypothetical protein